jgi:hypothetical protein
LNALKRFIEETRAEVIPEPDDDDDVTSCDPYDPEEWERGYTPRRPEATVAVDGRYL